MSTESSQNINGIIGALKNGKWKIQTTFIVVLLNICIAGIMTFINFAYISGRYTERFSLHESRLGTIENKIKDMDEKGTMNYHYNLDAENKEFGAIESRLNRIESETAHFDVIESEHRRLTKDVEDLKDKHAK